VIINQANLTGIYRSFSTIFNQAFDGAPSQWPIVAMQTPSEGRSVDYKWLGAFPGMREWLGDRVIKDVSAFHYELTNKDYEATVEVDRNDLDDDQIGVYKPMIQALGYGAKTHPDTLIFALMAAGFASLCYDGQLFFDTDHPVAGASVSNYGGGASTAWYLLDCSRPIKPFILQIRKRPEFVAQDRPDDENAFMRKKFRYGVDDRKAAGYGLWQLAWGDNNALNTTYYPAAYVAMMAFKDDNGVPLGIKPTHLVVPPSLMASGMALVDAQTTAAGAANVWYKTTQLVVAPWLA
jgi:phage major head subunit gpT-like protein